MQDTEWDTFCDDEVAVARKKGCESAEGPCEACMGTRWISYDVYSEGGLLYPTAEECPGEGLKRRLDLFNRALLPGKHHRCGFSNYEDVAPQSFPIRDRLVRWAQGYRPDMPGQRGLLIAGPNGVGKTHLLVAVARFLTINRGIEVLYRDWGSIVSSMRSAISEKRDVEEVLMPLRRTKVLILDELGRGKATDWQQRALEGVIDSRYKNEMVTTLVATNLDDSDLRQNVQDLIMSRLAEVCEQVVLDGDDYRQTGGRT
jgi:DNA replication protein DnaC